MVDAKRHSSSSPKSRRRPHHVVRIAALKLDEALACLRWHQPDFAIENPTKSRAHSYGLRFARRLNRYTGNAMSSKIKRPDYDEDFDSPEGGKDVNEREELDLGFVEWRKHAARRFVAS